MILCVAITPALQRTIRMKSLRCGEVNRASGVTISASGKGVNVAVMAHMLGAPVRLVGFAGGQTGSEMKKHLKSPPAKWISTRAATRVCTTMLDGARGKATEVVEEAENPRPQEWRQFWSALTAEIRRARLVIVSGALSPVMSRDLYNKVVALCDRLGRPVLIDSHGPALVHAITPGVLLAKMNREEMSRTGKPADLLRRGAKWVLVTDGPRAARLYSKDGLQDFRPKRVKVVNPIGCGDAVMAGIAVALLRGHSFPEAVDYGIRCGTYKATKPLPAQLDSFKLPLAPRR